MRSKPDASSDISLSPQSQCFSPHEDDEETLWEVIEITAEKGRVYKVRWKGTDPKTRKPWPQSWVNKTDCTDDLVQAWRKKKKEKERRKSSKKKGRDSTASKRTAHASIASTSRTTGRSDSMATTKSTASTTKGSTVKRDREVEKVKGKAKGKDKGKSKQIVPDVDIKNDEEEEEEEEHEDEDERARHLTNSKGTKRKYSEVQSANSSANRTSGRGGTVDVEAGDGENEDEEETEMERIVETEVVGGKKRVTVTTRPRKKRRIVLREASDEAPRNRPNGHGRRRGKHLTQDEEDMDDDERMVEEVLSQGLVSPGRADEADMGSDVDTADDVPDIDDGQDYPMGNEENEAEEELKEIQSKPVSAPAEGDDDDNDMEITGPYRLPTPATTSQTDGKARNNVNNKLARVVPQLPRKRDRDVKPTSAENSHALTSKTNAKKIPVSLGAKKGGKGHVESESESESDSGRPPPPEWNLEDGGRRSKPREREGRLGASGRLAHATDDQDSDGVTAVAVPEPELRQEQDEIDIESDPERRAILSPRARSRLVRFDIEVMGKKPDELGEMQLKDGRGVLKTNTRLKESAVLAREGSGTRPTPPTPELPLLSRKFQPTRTYQLAEVEFEGEVVPETEAENSQSQSRSHSLSQSQEIVKYAKMPPAATQAIISQSSDQIPLVYGVDEPREPNVLTPAQSWSLGEVKAVEKPPLPLPSPAPNMSFTLLKTTALRPPECVNGQDHGHSAQREREKHFTTTMTTTTAATKFLRPLPHLSPSTFRAHFVEQVDPPVSSLPDSIVEPSSSNERVVVEAIEEFDSPDKELRSESGFGGNTKKVIVFGKNGCPKEVENGGGGLEMKGLERKEKIKKRKLEDVIADVRGRTLPVNSDDEERMEDEEDVADASTTVVPPASGPPASAAAVDDSQLEEPREETIERMEEKYMDLSGGMDMDVDDEGMDDARAGSREETDVDIRLLRQEEEESTQDILAEVRALEERNLGMNVPTAPAPATALGGVRADARREMPQSSQSGTRASSRRPRSRSVVSEENHDRQESVQRRPMTRSRSRSQTPSVIAMSNDNKRAGRGKKKALEIPSPVPSRGESVELEASPVDVFQNAQGGSSKESSILAAQVLSLESQLADRQRKDELLQQELLSWRDRVKKMQEEKAALEAENEKRVVDIGAQLEAERATWEAQRAELMGQVEVLIKEKKQAEQDREFIREQYASASAYVTAIREENVDLEQRMKIAEGQAKSGVELIKATYELRLKTLENDVRMGRRLTTFMLDKDSRTNDEIRRRAAEEPELREMCGQQRRALREERGRRERLEGEVDALREENARLVGKLERDELVYRCMWRMDGLQACPEMFPTVQELEQHMLDGGHLS